MTRNYYATSDHRNIGMIVGAYCDMVQGRINEGFSLFSSPLCSGRYADLETR